MLMQLTVFAQDVNLKAIVKNQVSAGEQFQLVFELNAEGQNFRGPQFTDWRVLTGPMSSTNSSIQIINGQMSRNFTQSYTYVLMAKAEGNFTIGSATITVDGKSYKSDPVTIKVTTANAAAQNSTAGSEPGANGEISSKDIFLRAIVDKKM